MHFEVHADCPSCRVEGTVTETWDTETACGRLGLPLSTCCRLCGRTCEARARAEDGPIAAAGCPTCGAELDDACRDAHNCATCGASARLDETRPGGTFPSPQHLEAALAAWAREEGFSSARELLESAFVLGTVDAVHAALRRGEVVETTFDVADLLFGSGTSSGGGEPIAVAPSPDDTVQMAPPDCSPPSSSPPITLRAPPPSIRQYGGPRDELLALASVAAADGEANAGDLLALERAARARNVEPLALEEVHVRRPGEVDPPPTLVDRERVLEEMFQMAWADGELDESELRVIRDFGRVWGIDPERIAEWTRLYDFREKSGFLLWFRRIGQMIFPER